MAAQPQPRFTPEQYLELERAAEFRHEFYNGRIHAMAGGTYRHAHLIGNITGELRSALKDRPCIVTPSEVRVRVAPDGLYTYPDVAVVCGEPKFADAHGDTLTNASLIVEVLSPSTEAYDRGFKFAQYRTLGSLQEYALVSQTEPRVEVFRRQSGGNWLLTEAVSLESVCTLESVDCRIALAAIYEKVTFGEEEPAPR